MSLLISFAVFIAAMIVSLSAGITMILPLGVGLTAFTVTALRGGFRLPAILKMILKGMRNSLVVVVILLLIGCLTSLWRQCGTIAYFTDYGIRLIPPRIFILAAFLLTSIMAYALGTSFGTAGAIGVILMTIARANGISPAMTGGAILSGLYFGDRGSPASSSASLVANVSGTDVSENFKRMLPSSALPMLVCAALYTVLSLTTDAGNVDLSILNDFETEFHLSLWCLLPTVLLLGLAFAGLKIRHVMEIDILVSFVMTLLLQKTPVVDVLRMTLLGYTPKNPALTATLAGGGVKSMLEVACILLLSNGCAGIFEGTRMLRTVQRALKALADRAGRFPAMVVTSFGVVAVFCNQTIGTIMCRQVMERCYGDTPGERQALMLDLENSVITVAAIVPWCIASSVPIRLLGCGTAAIPFAAYLYLLPIFWQLHLMRKERLS